MEYRIREYHKTFSVEGLFVTTKKHLFKKDEIKSEWCLLTMWGSRWFIPHVGPLPPSADFKLLDEAEEFIDMLLKPEKFHYYP